MTFLLPLNIKGFCALCLFLMLDFNASTFWMCFTKAWISFPLPSTCLLFVYWLEDFSVVVTYWCYVCFECFVPTLYSSILANFNVGSFLDVPCNTDNYDDSFLFATRLYWCSIWIYISISFLCPEGYSEPGQTSKMEFQPFSYFRN